MDDKENVLLIIDYQKGFINPNSKKVIKPITEIATKFKWDKVFQAMWFNSGAEHDLFMKNVNYSDCQMDDRSASLKRLFNGAIVLPRVNSYSCITKEFLSLINYNMNIFIVGLETDACVLASCFALFDRGVDFKVIGEGVSSKREEVDNAARLVMRRQFGKRSIISIDEVEVPVKSSYVSSLFENIMEKVERQVCIK